MHAVRIVFGLFERRSIISQRVSGEVKVKIMSRVAHRGLQLRDIILLINAKALLCAASEVPRGSRHHHEIDDIENLGCCRGVDGSRQAWFQRNLQPCTSLCAVRAVDLSAPGVDGDLLHAVHPRRTATRQKPRTGHHRTYARNSHEHPAQRLLQADKPGAGGEKKYTRRHGGNNISHIIGGRVDFIPRAGAPTLVVVRFAETATQFTCTTLAVFVCPTPATGNTYPGSFSPWPSPVVV